MFFELNNLLYFLYLSMCLSIILICFSFYFIDIQYDSDKISAYECGFDPFEDSLYQFDIKFYLVSIIFILFDIEISFLFPWIIVFDQLDLFNFIIIILFLLILCISFLYEWYRGALDWI